MHRRWFPLTQTKTTYSMGLDQPKSRLMKRERCSMMSSPLETLEASPGVHRSAHIVVDVSGCGGWHRVCGHLLCARVPVTSIVCNALCDKPSICALLGCIHIWYTELKYFQRVLKALAHN